MKRKGAVKGTTLEINTYTAAADPQQIFKSIKGQCTDQMSRAMYVFRVWRRDLQAIVLYERLSTIRHGSSFQPWKRGVSQMVRYRKVRAYLAPAAIHNKGMAQTLASDVRLRVIGRRLPMHLIITAICHSRTGISYDVVKLRNLLIVSSSKSLMRGCESGN